MAVPPKSTPATTCTLRLASVLRFSRPSQISRTADSRTHEARERIPWCCRRTNRRRAKTFGSPDVLTLRGTSAFGFIAVGSERSGQTLFGSLQAFLDHFHIRDFLGIDMAQ